MNNICVTGVSKQRGVSLTELMISLCLSSLLMMALIQTYMSGKRQYMHSQQVIEQGFELQLVSELMRESVRSAGFAPCIGINHLMTKDHRGRPERLAAIKFGVGNSHSVTFARMGEDYARVLKQISPNRLLVEGRHAFDTRHPVVIADCFHAEVHFVASSQKMPEGRVVTLTKPLAFNYSLPCSLGEWLEERFYIEKNNQGKPALFYDTYHREELTDLVDGLSNRLEHSLLHTTLKLAKGGELVLDTRIRTP